MLNKKIFCVLIFTLFVSVGFAQTTPTKDYNKNDFYVGYSHQRDKPISFNGIEGSGVRNFTRYFGIKGDFSAAFRDRTPTGGVNSGGVTTTFPVRSKTQIYNFLGAVQVKDNATKTRFKPFAYALIGVDRFKNRVPNFCSSNPPDRLCNVVIPSEGSNVGFAAAVGGD